MKGLPHKDLAAGSDRMSGRWLHIDRQTHILSHSEYLQLLSTKIKYYLIYWSRRALENPCLLPESVCGLHFVDRCSTWRQRGNSMTAASRFWRLADFEAALRLVDVRISELCQGFRLDMP